MTTIYTLIGIVLLGTLLSVVIIGALVVCIPVALLTFTLIYGCIVGCCCCLHNRHQPKKKKKKRLDTAFQSDLETTTRVIHTSPVDDSTPRS
jgi:hypothetical protein